MFAVVHGSQPKFTIPECIADVNRAVRYIRTHAADYKIDPNRIGISGASAGGHLSLMLGCAGTEGDPKAKDPVERASSRVQAVACFFPPTDFLNYGKPGIKSLGIEPAHKFKAPFDFHEQDKATKLFMPVDMETRERIVREVSPIYHVTKDDAPALIISRRRRRIGSAAAVGDHRGEVQGSRRAVELIVKKGAGHGVLAVDVLRGLPDLFQLVRQAPEARHRRAGRGLNSSRPKGVS